MKEIFITFDYNVQQHSLQSFGYSSFELTDLALDR